MEEKMKEETSQFMGDTKRVVASAKAASGVSLDEGKKLWYFMSTESYETIYIEV